MSAELAPDPDLTVLANRYGSDKGSTVLCAHHYTKVYGALLRKARRQPLRLLEVGLVHGHTQQVLGGALPRMGCPSLLMWSDYLPDATVFGFDIVNFRSLANGRVTIFQGDQGNREDLERVAEESGGNFDVIIDDGSHASHHQQISLGVLFRHLAPGGIYCIEDMHYQPTDMELAGISRTREFLRELRTGQTGARIAMEQTELVYLANEIRGIRFFDSQSERWPLGTREDALAILVKRGSNPWLDIASELGISA